MKFAARFVLVAAFALSACRTTKEVAVSTFKVIDAPANFIRHRIDQSEGATTTTTTTTTTSDVSNPGYPVTTTAPPPQAAMTPRRTVTSSSATQRTQTAPRKTSPTATPRTAATQPTQQYPTARAVPGRPGFVYSLDPNGGMIDITGYKSGDKAKDPYTKQIFIVP
ncbi:MAG TPA: hypothetical protein VGC85_09400 [Chthoniobacterales bacterium]